MVRFELGADLSFFVADTRINRDAPRSETPIGDPAPRRFMLADDFDELLSWISGLTALGVLVLGQPLLTKPGNARDRGLADFPKQYAPLCRALASARRDVVVLSGDVHFGRVAEIETRASGAPGGQLTAGTARWSPEPFRPAASRRPSP